MYKIDSFNKSPQKILKKEPTIEFNCILKDCSFGEYVEIGSNNNIQETIIDSYSYTSENCQIIDSNIGKFVNIASYVRLNPGQHPMHWASQHHMLYRRNIFGFGADDLSFFDWRREKKVRIGHDVWIGHNVTVMGGVTIGNGAVIGTGTIVTKNIPPYAIAVGNPAKVIKYRFDEIMIDKLEAMSWWNWEHETIHARIDDFSNIEQFIEKYSK